MVVIHGELPEQKLMLQIILFYHFIHLRPSLLLLTPDSLTM